METSMVGIMTQSNLLHLIRIDTNKRKTENSKRLGFHSFVEIILLTKMHALQF